MNCYLTNIIRHDKPRAGKGGTGPVTAILYVGSYMNIEELLQFITIVGRYEVITSLDGTYAVIPIPAEAILITKESHQQLSTHFKPDEL